MTLIYKLNIKYFNCKFSTTIQNERNNEKLKIAPLTRVKQLLNILLTITNLQLQTRWVIVTNYVKYEKLLFNDNFCFIAFMSVANSLLRNLTMMIWSVKNTAWNDKIIIASVNVFCCRIFEKIRYYFGNSSESIPMSFVLGFYVSLIVKRWWEQYRLLPWPDNLALFISAAIPGNVSILFAYIHKCQNL